MDAADSGQYVQEQAWRGTDSTSEACARAAKLASARRSSCACSSKQRSVGGTGACCIGLGAPHMVLVKVLGRLERLPSVYTNFVQPPADLLFERLAEELTQSSRSRL